MTPPTTVVLLHGLHRTRFSMRRIERRLRDEGFETQNLGYPSARYPIERLAEIVEAELARRAPAGRAPLHFVTHSMGGILVRALARRKTAPAIGRVVMLAPPNAGSEIVDWLERLPYVRAALGAARRQLRTGNAGVPAGLGPPPFELGVIAGTSAGISPFRRLVPTPGDGTVSVTSTRLSGMQDFVAVRCAHTFLMNDPAVMDQTVAFLRTGRFVGGEGPAG